MDRSSMHRVETTYDKEKRAAFKEKLTSKIVEKEVVLAPIFSNPLEGAAVWHPDFGVCTVLSVDEKANLLTMTTPQNGRVDLIFSQIKSKLVPIDDAPAHVVKEFYKPTMARNATFFNIGSKALSLQLPNEFKKWSTANQFGYLTRNQHLTTDEANDVFAHLTGKKLLVLSAVEVNWHDPVASAEPRIEIPLAEIIPDTHIWLTGRKVWHLDLGVCTVVSLDSKFITLDFPDKGQVEMVRSMVQPRLSLTEIDRLDRVSDYQPAHSPVSKEPVAAKPAKDLSVELPPVFTTWTMSDQFKFLTRNQHLTTNEANDVFAQLENKPLLVANSVSVIWVDPVPVEAPVEPVIVPEKVSAYAGWVGKQIWHLDLGVCTVLDLDEKSNSVVLDFPSIGKLDMALSYVQPRLSLTEVETLDRALKYKPPVAPALIPEVAPRRLAVILPPAFKTWHAYKQYSYLHTEKQLSPEEAKDVLSILSGAKPVTKTVFQIDWNEQADLAKVEAANRHLEELATVPVKKETVSLPVIPGATRSVEEKDVVEKVTVTRLSVQLPDVFASWSVRDQYIFLTSNCRLSPDEAQDVLTIRQGKQPLSNRKIEITDTHDLLNTDFVAKRVVEELGVVKKETTATKLSVSVPPTFKTWSASDQYLFLSRTKHLTVDESNDIIDILHGKQPRLKNVLFEIIEEPLPSGAM